MTGKGSISRNPNLRLRIFILAHLGWLAMLCLLGAWWGRLVLRQAYRISELEGALGLSADLTQSHWHHVQRMLFWESGTFFTLLLMSSFFLLWLYWRDLKRARGLQAFFASVTHELRTPLTSIRLQAESIADRMDQSGEAGSPVAGLLTRLLEDTIRLESQVERTLELARVEGGGPVYVQPIPLKSWLDRFLKTWSRDYPGRVEIQSRIDEPWEDQWIEADPTALQVIFKNILENSVRHSKQEKVKIGLFCKKQRDRISVAVQDQGAGFSGNAKTLGKLFQKGPNSQGTGVGLYLVRVLMKRMRGEAHFGADSQGFTVNLGFRAFPVGSFEEKSHG